MNWALYHRRRKPKKGELVCESDAASNIPPPRKFRSNGIDIIVSHSESDISHLLETCGESCLVIHEDGEVMWRQDLSEMTYSELMTLTRMNGNYKVGGLRKVNGVWINDPSIRGRAQNARFVITQPGTIERDDDGMLMLRFTYTSRPDRNTTGGSHTGYIKFLQPQGFFRKLLRKFVPAHQYNQDVEVHCSCQDHTYRYAKLLSDRGAGRKTVGVGDQLPVVTNPEGKISLCKHLASVAGFLQMSPKDEKKVKSDLDREHFYVRGRGQSVGVFDGADVEPKS